MKSTNPLSGVFWPENEDNLFSVTNTVSSSDLTWQKHFDTREFGYIRAYKMSADILVNHLYRDDAGWNHAEHDLLVYPILFIYRHIIELQLKSLLALGHQLDGSEFPEKEMNSHNLNILWRKFSEYIHKHYPQETKEDSFISVQRIINQLHQTDPSGFAFRYHTNKERSELSFSGIDRIDLANVGGIMEGVYNWLAAGIDMFTNDLDIKRDIEATFNLLPNDIT